jgi:hypothetical protein
MALLIRITNGDESNPIVLEDASEIILYERFKDKSNIRFTLPPNDPKIKSIGIENLYTKLWECWDTATNERLDHGPIHNVSESDSNNLEITGPGKAQFLEDIISSKRTYFYPINRLLDDLRYENLSIAPATTAWAVGNDSPSNINVIDATVNSAPIATGPFLVSAMQVGPTDTFDQEKFNGLSKKTAINAIDDLDPSYDFGANKPKNTWYTTNYYWAGSNNSDTLIVDLGKTFKVAKVSLLFPWWGGPATTSNRTYDWALFYSRDDEANPLSPDRIIGKPHAYIYPSHYEPEDWYSWFRPPFPNKLVTSPHNEIYVYATASGYEPWQYLAGTGNPIEARHIMVDIPYVYAWYGSIWDDANPTNRWNYQCNPSFVPGYPALVTPPDLRYGNYSYYDSGGIGTGWTSKKGLMTGKTFSSSAIDARGDCRASLVEVGVYREIFKRKKITNHVLRQIQHDNRQITYQHTPDATETRTINKSGTNYRYFEPGTFFKSVVLNYTTGSSLYDKFYKNDCSSCYGKFSFGLLDQNNSMIKYSTELSKTFSNVTVNLPAFTKHIIIKPGNSSTVVTSVDAWHGKMDGLSFGGSYAYTHKAGDTAIVHFRGTSFIWWSTVPAGSDAGQVKIEIRSKPDGSNWGAWSTIVDSLTLPVGVAAYKVWEIPLNSGILVENTVYEIKITTLNSGFVSIDGFGGYWESEYSEINEDHEKVRMSSPNNFKQIYNEKLSNASAYKLNKTGSSLSYTFKGDRVLLKMAKGPNNGRVKIWITRGYRPYDALDAVVNIPGGNTDGSLVLDMETGTSRGHVIPQAVVFDSKNYFADGLPWGTYTISLCLERIEKKKIPANEATDEDFVNTCDKCRITSSKTQVTIVKPLYIDGFGAHEETGISLKFVNENQFKQLQTVCDSLHMDWEITTKDELNVVPRIGTDYNIIIKEGHDVLVRKQIVRDASVVATHLLSYAGDVNGEPIYNVLEDKYNSAIMGRTVTRTYDYKNLTDYITLAGAQRIELEKRRRKPEYRIMVTLANTDYGLKNGDTFRLKAKDFDERVQVIAKSSGQSVSEGRYYELECVKWVPMI